MNIQVDPMSSNLASAMLNLKIRPRVVVGYGVKIFHPSPPNYVTRSPGNDGIYIFSNLVSRMYSTVAKGIESSCKFFFLDTDVQNNGCSSSPTVAYT